MAKVIKRLTPEVVDAYAAKGLTHISWKLKEPYHFIVDFHSTSVPDSLPGATFKKEYLQDENYTIEYIFGKQGLP